MREAGRIVARVHVALREAVRPGVSTWELDQLAVETMAKYDATSCFLGYRGYPANICASINEELVHGIPNKDRILKEGDIISIDIGVRYRGFIGDSAWTYAVGEITPKARELMRVTEESLYAGIAQGHGRQPGRGCQPGRAAARGGARAAHRARIHGAWRGAADARGAAGAELCER